MLEDRLRKSRVSEYTIIRDDVFEKFLEELVKTEVRNNVVLQGGNALRFGYGSPRYSNDLDFVLRDNEIDSEKFAKICESLSRVASAIKGYVGAVRIKKVKERLYMLQLVKTIQEGAFTISPKSHFFGFDEDGIAEPEKALLDLIYRESQKGKAGIFYLHQIFHDIDWEELSIQKLDKYAKRMGINWRKYLPEKTDSRHPELAELIRESFK